MHTTAQGEPKIAAQHEGSRAQEMKEQGEISLAYMSGRSLATYGQAVLPKLYNSPSP